MTLRLPTSGLELPQIRAAGVVLLIFCLGLGVKLYRSGPDRTRTTDQSFALRVDPNTAGRAELASLPELGNSVAQRIIDFRTAAQNRGESRPFKRLLDLDRVPGIGPATLEAIEAHLCFEPVGK